jgi:hypothetical protein
VKVPKSFKQVTVEQFQELLPIYKKALEETDSMKNINHWVNIIAILADCTLEEVEAIDISDLKAIINKLGWLNKDVPGGTKKTLWLNGTLYVAPKNAKGFNTARYVEIKTFLGRDGLIPEMHNILASIYQPYFKSKQTHEERAYEFRKAKVGDVAPTVFFYTKVYKNLTKRIQEYGIKVMEEKMKEVDVVLQETLKEILEDIGDGTALLTK